MSRELHYTAIVLKKQPFSEGDELITFFTKEAGKLRALAKSVKFSKSKLQQKLQDLFLIRLGLAQGSLPKVIEAEPERVFVNLRENLAAVKMAIYASELALKFTPDEQKNEALFFLLRDFFEFLDARGSKPILNYGLAKFKIGVLQAVGLEIAYLPKTKFFSPLLGGFTAAKSTDAWPVDSLILELFSSLKAGGFGDLANLDSPAIGELQNLLSRFIEYQLERSVKSDKYLD